MCIFLFSACAHAQCATSIVQFLRPELYVYVLLNLLYYTKSPLSCGEGTMIKFNGFNSDVVCFAQRVKKAMMQEVQLRPKMMIKWSKGQFSFQHI